ncbi:hypothetical protein CLI85_06090 [Tannerella forsythia]|nr:hypothetical protein CLI85_06090 [Tannerella forsythia]
MCEAHEALTFGLLLGQAKSDRKEIMSGFQPSKQGADMDTPPLRDGAETYRACSPCAPCRQTYRAQMEANKRLCHSEHREHGIRTQITQRTVFVIPNIVRNPTGKRREILRFALNDKLIVNCQWLSIMRSTRRIMYLENNH